MIDPDKYTTETTKKITNILAGALDWEQDRVFGFGNITCITEQKLADMVASLVREDIGDIAVVANIWSQYANQIEQERDVARRAVRKFATQVSCARCPYKGRCDITNADPRNNYEDCYKKILEFAEQDLKEERR